MPIRVDFTNASTSFTPLDPGPYPAKLVKVEMSDKEGSSGHHSLIFEWKIVGTNRTVKFDYYSLSPQALWRLKKALSAMDVEFPDVVDDIMEVAREAVGREATLVLKVDEYEGKDGSTKLNNKVDTVEPAE